MEPTDLPNLSTNYLLLWLFTKTKELNAMTIGDETASTLGISVREFRLSVFVIGALITGAMVAFSGIIGFVALMIPHSQINRWRRLQTSLMGSAISGAIFLLWADIVARKIMAPEDLPIGIVTGFLVEYFLFGCYVEIASINCKYCVYRNFKPQSKPKNLSIT